MPRTTEDLVSGIIETDEAISLTPFITAASTLVERLLPVTTETDELWQQVETWLAAHFYALRDRRVSSAGVGGATETFERPVLGKGLDQTTYGQTAMTLDISGTLATWNNDMSDISGGDKSLEWLGTAPKV